MNDLISVIIPVYKVEDYLSRCVSSILGQTYRNLEIILVDDGSPDRCGEMCDDFAKMDDRIKVIHKNNGGLSDARNAGIEIAKGEYLTFLDSDDWVHREYIERLYQLLITSKSDIAVCNFIRTSNENIVVEPSKVEIYEFSNIEALEHLTGKFYVQLVVSWGKIYHKDLFKEIRYPLGKIHEDEYVAHQLLYKARKIVFTTEQMLYYWQRDDSIMGTGFNLRNRLHVLQAYHERAQFFEEIGRSKLRDKTFRSLFGIYMSINENIYLFNDEESKNKYLDDFNCFKIKLRSSKQSLPFRLFYEIYFISPKLAHTTKTIYKKMKRLL